MLIEVFTDGSATIAAKPGGYGWVLIVDGVKHSEGNGHLDRSTNNDAEMEAAIAGLTAAYKVYLHRKATDIDCYQPYDVVLCSDSQVTLGWADGTYKFKQKAKYKRFEILQELVRRMGAKTKWVRGHAGNVHNERCDELANLGRHKLGPNDSLPAKPSKKGKKSKQLPKSGNQSSKIGKKTDNVFNIWFDGKLKIIDLEHNICEDHDEAIHGPRGSRMEYRNK